MAYPLLLQVLFPGGSCPFSHCFCCQYVPNFRGENERASIVPFVEIDKDLSRLRWLVFVDEMTCFREDLKLVFS